MNGRVKLTLAIAFACALFLQPAPARPPILGVAHVRLLSSDLARARAFYGTLLGFPELPQSDATVAIFRVNDRQRIIVRPGLRAKDDERFDNVGFSTDGDAVPYLRARGVGATWMSSSRETGGLPSQAVDPDGHRIWFVGAPLATAPAAGPDTRISSRILHVGLTIHDAAKADAFYKDVLGFSEIWRGGRTDGVVDWINMRVPDGTEYLEYMMTKDTPTRRQLGSAHHMALLVPSIQDALEAVRARTSPDDPNHRETPRIGVNRKWQLNVYDPDGTRIEFMEPWTAR